MSASSASTSAPGTGIHAETETTIDATGVTVSTPSRQLTSTADSEDASPSRMDSPDRQHPAATAVVDAAQYKDRTLRTTPLERPVLAMCRKVPCVNGGKPITFLLGDDGSVYRFAKTIASCLMGRVKTAVVCERSPDGNIRMTDQLVAIKILLKRCIQYKETTQGQKVKEDPAMEIRAMRYLGHPGHPHILSLKNILSDTDHVYVVLEYATGGELYRKTVSQGRFTEAQARIYFVQILRAVQYMHAKGVAHRDISLENIMLADSDGRNIKIIDFGVAAEVSVENDVLLPGEEPVGKQRYMSPEVYAGHPYDGKKADVWSLGVVLFMMVTGKPPYTNPSEALCGCFKMIANNELTKMLRLWGMESLLSDELEQLLSRMLQVNPSRRPTVAQLLSDPWLIMESRHFAEEYNQIETLARATAAAQKEIGDLNARFRQQPGRNIPRNAEDGGLRIRVERY